MRKSDASRLIGTVSGNKYATDELRRRPQEVAQAGRPAHIGTAIVRHVTAMGRDSFCDVAIIEKGRPTGREWDNAVCYGSRLTVGATVAYVIRDDNTMELIAGGGGSTGSSSSSVGNIINTDGWEGE